MPSSVTVAATPAAAAPSGAHADASDAPAGAPEASTSGSGAAVPPAPDSAPLAHSVFGNAFKPTNFMMEEISEEDCEILLQGNSPSDDDEDSENQEWFADVSDSDEDSAEEGSAFNPDTPPSPVARSSSRRVQASAPERPTSASIKAIVRTRKAAAALYHYSIFNPSSAQLSIVVDAVLSRVDTSDVMKVQAKVERFLPEDWAEVRACCGCTEDDLKLAHLPERHPFREYAEFVAFRCDFVRSENQISKLQQYIINRVDDPLVDASSKKNQIPNRCVMLEGGRVCQSCLRAATGVDRSTIFRIQSDIRNGKRGDAAGAGAVARRSPVTDALVAAFQAMVKQGFAEPIPNPTDKCDMKCSYEVPFTTRKDLMEYLTTQVPEVMNSLRKDADGSLKLHSSTVGRALDLLNKDHQISISLSKVKRFMRCSVCKNLDNQLHQAKTTAEKQQVNHQRAMHFRQVAAQRDYYHMQRDIAKSVYTAPLRWLSLLLWRS